MEKESAPVDRRRTGASLAPLVVTALATALRGQVLAHGHQSARLATITSRPGPCRDGVFACWHSAVVKILAGQATWERGAGKIHATKKGVKSFVVQAV
jgi:hypothetical protein